MLKGRTFTHITSSQVYLCPFTVCELTGRTYCLIEIVQNHRLSLRFPRLDWTNCCETNNTQNYNTRNQFSYWLFYIFFVVLSLFWLYSDIKSYSAGGDCRHTNQMTECQVIFLTCETSLKLHSTSSLQHSSSQLRKKLIKESITYLYKPFRTCGLPVPWILQVFYYRCNTFKLFFRFKVL